VSEAVWDYATWKLKLEVLTHYGASPRYDRCGFEDARALTIDHVEGLPSRGLWVRTA